MSAGKGRWKLMAGDAGLSREEKGCEFHWMKLVCKTGRQADWSAGRDISRNLGRHVLILWHRETLLVH